MIKVTCLLILVLLQTCKCKVYSNPIDDIPVTLSSSAFAAANIDVYSKDDNTHDCTPKQIHLATGQEPWNSMVVSFSTSCGPDRSTFSICYGSDPTKLEDIVYANTKRDMKQYNYTDSKQEDSEEEEILYVSDFIYHVPLENLKDSKKYYYRINVELIDKEANQSPSSKSNNGPVDVKSTPKTSDLPIYRSYGYVALITRLMKERAKNTDSSGLRGYNEQQSIDIKYPDTESNPLHFTTAPLPGRFTNADGDPVKISIIGDLGQTYNSSLTMYHMFLESEGVPIRQSQDHESKASIAICVGDMSYANGNQNRWDSWFELISPLTSIVPFMVAAGNHEIESDNDNRQPFTAYENRFAMPKLKDAKWGENEEYSVEDVDHDPSNIIDYSLLHKGYNYYNYDYGNSYYAFTYGIARVIVTNCYTNSSKGTSQYDFVVNELSAVDRDITPWVLIMMHNPYYNTFRAHINEKNTLEMQAALEPLFVKYHVNIVFAGHTHGYMRSKNIAMGDLDERGPVYVIVGEGGNREEHVKDYLNDVPEEWVAVRDKTMFGFGTIETVNRTHARWKWVRSDDLDVAGLSDDVYIENQFYLLDSETSAMVN